MIKQHVMELIERLEAGLKENAEETKEYKGHLAARKPFMGDTCTDDAIRYYNKHLAKLKEENHKLLMLIEHLEDSIKDL